MASILPDKEIAKLLGVCILDGQRECLKPNSYQLRLGPNVRFHSTNERKVLQPDQFLEVNPGETVTINSLERIDFTKETVRNLFADAMLLGFITPTTTMMREGVFGASTKIDAGFRGRLNWGFRNSSFKPVILKYGEKIFKLTIFRLAPDEFPDLPYGERETDSYQDTEDIAPSSRHIPADIAPQAIVRATSQKIDHKKQLQQAGYPFDHIGTELVQLHGKFEVVSTSVSAIKDELSKQTTSLSSKVDDLKASLAEKIESVVNKKMIAIYGVIISAGGFGLALMQYLRQFAATSAQVLVFAAIGFVALVLTLLLTRK